MKDLRPIEIVYASDERASEGAVKIKVLPPCDVDV